ncbi:M48 family metallopeptidase [Chlamydia buteonis]|uniref:M48 family metallopeptidase n=1 Tax=Chlamydia buteonis TaxID=2494525 RepID=A0ABX8L8W4_9CHLA|nr:M48 family metallopeptidase [Chlamydia buteonis]QXE27398.1 SprT family zinc-dependent metalloprotease [Chlamydia buteonis]QXE27707.1 M48 family metallopeptidase [Chlamydia buteonis]
MSFQKIRKLLKNFFRARLISKSCSMNPSKIVRPQLIRSSIPVDYTPGKVYNLEKIYQDLNLRLFEGFLNLKIGWFGRERSGSALRAVLGSYHEEEKLIRIHRSLDSDDIPLFFMEYIIYHEMVHSVVPLEYSPSGRTIFHGKKFKECEKRFPLYESAIAWEKANIYVLLQGYKSRIGKKDGRT